MAGSQQGRVQQPGVAPPVQPGAPAVSALRPSADTGTQAAARASVPATGSGSSGANAR